MITIDVCGMEATNIYNRMVERVHLLKTLIKKKKKKATHNKTTTRITARNFNIYHSRWQSTTEFQQVERLTRNWV